MVALFLIVSCWMFFNCLGTLFDWFGLWGEYCFETCVPRVILWVFCLCWALFDCDCALLALVCRVALGTRQWTGRKDMQHVIPVPVLVRPGSSPGSSRWLWNPGLSETLVIVDTVVTIKRENLFCHQVGLSWSCRAVICSRILSARSSDWAWFRGLFF